MTSCRGGGSGRRSAARSPAIIRSVVVLPEPDGPSIEKNSPSGTSRSMPATATTSPKRFSTAWMTWTRDRPDGVVRRSGLADGTVETGSRDGLGRRVGSGARPGLRSGIGRGRALGLVGSTAPGRASRPNAGSAARCHARPGRVSSTTTGAVPYRLRHRLPRVVPPRRSRCAWLPSRWSRSRPSPARRRASRRHAADRARRLVDAARGQHHHQGLFVPARRGRPRAGRDRPAPRHQRRARGPRGGDRRCRGPGRLGGRRGRHGRTPRPARRRSSASRRTCRGCGSSSRRVSGSTSCGRSRPRPRPTPALGRRLPHPGPLGARDAGPDPLGRHARRS